MASTNTVVHILAAGGLFFCFYLISVLKKQERLFKDLYCSSGVKRLVRPARLLKRILTLYDLDYEVRGEIDKITDGLKLIKISDIGCILAVLQIEEATFIESRGSLEVRIGLSEVKEISEQNSLQDYEKRLEQAFGLSIRLYEMANIRQEN